MAYGYSQKKKDNNHNSITRDITALADKGIPISYLDTHVIGGGAQDTLIFCCGLTFAIEIKKPKGKLTMQEKKFADKQGEHGCYYVIRTTRQLIDAIDAELDRLTPALRKKYREEVISRLYEELEEMENV